MVGTFYEYWGWVFTNVNYYKYRVLFRPEGRSERARVCIPFKQVIFICINIHFLCSNLRNTTQKFKLARI